MKNRHFGSHIAAILLTCAALLAGCTSDSPESLLASAKQSMAKQDYKTAVIHIKNALQAKPELAEARFLLGKALMESGEVNAAQVELAKASELRYSADAVVPLLLRAWLVTGKFDKVISEGSKAPILGAEAKAEVATMLAQAFSASGRPTESEGAVAAALRAIPDYPAALVMQARLRAAGGDAAGALQLLDQVIAKAPNNAEAFKFKGDLLATEGRFQPAIAAYRRALEITPDMTAAHGALILAHVREGATLDAKTQLDAMKKAVPNSPNTVYATAVVAFSTRDFKTARDACQLLIKGLGDNYATFQLAGATEYNLGALTQAEEYFRRAVQLEPGSTNSRRFLALTYLGLGQAKKAVAALEPVIGKIESDAATLAVAGNAFMQSGDLERAERFLVKATKLDPKDPGKRTGAAMIRVAKGDIDGALADLVQISSEDKGTVADNALVATLVRRGDFDRAIKAIDTIDKKRPGDAATQNLRGEVQFAKKDFGGARKSFEIALRTNPGFVSAAERLAQMDLTDNNAPEAQRRFERVIEANPRSSAAMLGLAGLKVRSNAPADEVVNLINKAIAAQTADPEARGALVSHYLRVKEPKKAIAAAQDAVAAIPGNAEMLEFLGQAQQAGGEFNQALTTYEKIAALLPDSPNPYMRMAEIHHEAKNDTAAAQSLRKALEKRPDLLAAQRSLMTLSLRGGDPREALAIARLVQKQRPKEPVGYMLEGDVAMSRKAWDEAAEAFRTGLKQVKATPLAIRLHGALLAGGKPVEAEKLAATWLTNDAEGRGFRRYLAELASMRGDFAVAAAHYQNLLVAEPENPEVLNNLALVMAGAKQSGAIAYAEKANKLSPDRPEFMDTLAVLLAESGAAERALAIQEKATRLAPQDAGIRFNYARLLARAGKKAEARKELDELVKLGNRFPRQAEVATLIRDL